MEKAQNTDHHQGDSRRSFLGTLGFGSLLLGLVGQSYAFLRSLVPNVLYEAPRRFKIGRAEDISEGVHFLEDQRVFVVKEKGTFRTLSAVCTHLGCTVKYVKLGQPKTVREGGESVTIESEFHCPCHGSKFYGDGTNFAGPAPRPLASYKIEIAPEDGQLVVDLSKPVDRDYRLSV